MDGQKLKKHVLGSKKTERIIFAATPEMKEALETIAQEKCVSLSALLNVARRGGDPSKQGAIRTHRHREVSDCLAQFGA